MKYLSALFILFMMSLTACGPSAVFVSPGTPQVTVVPLCPGVSTYGTWIEVAQCIDGKLYGVFSYNNGFLTYLADGAYSSSAVGSACSFSISGCTVTPR